jgi:hypothetical protein
MDRQGPLLGVPTGGEDAAEAHLQRVQQKHWSHKHDPSDARPLYSSLPTPGLPHVGVQSGGAADLESLLWHHARRYMEADLQGPEKLADEDRGHQTRQREPNLSGKHSLSEDLFGRYFKYSKDYIAYLPYRAGRQGRSGSTVRRRCQRIRPHPS